ncbi:MAG: 50S ribosomal protein L4, partial [Nitrospinaceae bacterium]|nr:50S ribosomal protein L4 [Nitrospinaceae bacterium]
MSQVDVLDLDGKVVEQIELPESVFNGEVKLHLIHQMVKYQLAKRRAGTHSTLTRKEVSGTGAKPWRQKGTGRARAGDVKSPIWRSGGITFGPKPRSYKQRMPKKMRRGALMSALNLKLKEGKLKVIADFQFSEAKTKTAIDALNNLDAAGKTLLVSNEQQANFLTAVKN